MQLLKGLLDRHGTDCRNPSRNNSQFCGRATSTNSRDWRDFRSVSLPCPTQLLQQQLKQTKSNKHKFPWRPEIWDHLRTKGYVECIECRQFRLLVLHALHIGRESAGPGCVGCNEDSVGFHRFKHRMRLKSEETRLVSTKMFRSLVPFLLAIKSP